MTTVADLEHELHDVREAAAEMADTLRMCLDMLEPGARLCPDGLGALFVVLIGRDLARWQTVNGLVAERRKGQS